MADVGMCVDYTVGGTNRRSTNQPACSVTWEEYASGTPAHMSVSMYLPTRYRWEFRSSYGGLMDARFSRELAPDSEWASYAEYRAAFAQEIIYEGFREVEVEVTGRDAHLWFVGIRFVRHEERCEQRLDIEQLEELVAKLKSTFGLSLTDGADGRLVLRRQEQPESDSIL
jgi:hypothetical protein